MPLFLTASSFYSIFSQVPQTFRFRYHPYLHDALALHLDAAQLLAQHPQLVLHTAALDAAAACVEQVVLAAVTDLTLQLQQLLRSVRRAPARQTPRQLLLDLSQDALLRVHALLLTVGAGRSDAFLLSCSGLRENQSS